MESNVFLNPNILQNILFCVILVNCCFKHCFCGCCSIIAQCIVRSHWSRSNIVCVVNMKYGILYNMYNKYEICFEDFQFMHRQTNSLSLETFATNVTSLIRTQGEACQVVNTGGWFPAAQIVLHWHYCVDQELCWNHPDGAGSEMRGL